MALLSSEVQTGWGSASELTELWAKLRPTSNLSHGGLSPGLLHVLADGFPQKPEIWERERERAEALTVQATVFGSLISEVTSHHFRRILLIRDEPLNPTDTEGRGLHRTRWPGAGTVRGHFRHCLAGWIQYCHSSQSQTCVQMTREPRCVLINW